MVSLDFPAALSQRVINALKADPNTVDLRAQAPHFYALGSRILELFEEEEIVDVLLEVREPYLFIDICAWLSQH
jgi:GINS complex subunit 3